MSDVSILSSGSLPGAAVALMTSMSFAVVLSVSPVVFEYLKLPVSLAIAAYR